MSKSIGFIESMLSRAWTRILRSVAVSAPNAAIFRILLGFYLLLFLTPNFMWISDVPPTFFLPPLLSHTNLFQEFPPDAYYRLASLLIPLLILLFTLGVRVRWSGPVLAFAVVFFKGFQYSLGKIDHGLLIWATLLLLSFSNIGTRYALLPDPTVSQERHNKCFGLLALCICFGFFSAGFEKALVWIDFQTETSGFLGWFYGNYFSNYRRELLAEYVFSIPIQWFEPADYIAVAFELSPFLFLLTGPRAWRMWLTVACVFHLANTLVMNISFWSHVPVYGAFLLFRADARVDSDARTNPRRTSLDMLWMIAAAAVATTHIVQRATNGSSKILWIPDDWTSVEDNLIFAIALWSALLAVSARHLWNTVEVRSAVQKHLERK